MARKFAETYKVALLTRSESTSAPTVEAIKKKFGEDRAVGISCDLSKAEDVKAAFENLTRRSDWSYLAAAIFNGAGGFVVKPFLDLTEKEFTSGAGANG